MASTIFSGNEVKTLKDVLSLNDKAKVIPVNSDPTSGAGVAAPIGSLALDYSSGRIYRKTGSLATEWQSLGSGVGGINYIANPDAESGTTGWATYADAAGSAPVDGTGGTANITWSRSTSSPLRGIADFNLVKDAVNRQGQGVSYDFTIDPADLAKVLTVTFNYEILSGTYATGDLAVYLIQDPAGTPVVIQPAGFQVQSATTGTKMREIATFQTDSTVTTYRLCIHVASTSASAYSLAIDNVQVGPQVVQYGAPITDWQAYTPSASINQGLGTLANVDVYWRRVGADIEIRGSFTTGTVAASEARLALPAGLSTTSDVTQNTIIGVFGRGVSTATKGGFMIKQNNVNYVCFSANAVFSGNTTISTNPELGSAIFSSGDKVSIQLSVPIQGWSSTVQMSNDTDTRVVAATASNLSSGSYSSSAQYNYSNILYDTHGAITTGASWKYTVPVSGYYSFSVTGTIQSGAAGTVLSLYKNGSALVNMVDYPVSGYRCSASVTVALVAGDVVDLRPGASSTFTPGVLSIQRLSGPSAIAASETVAASYYLPADQSAGATTPINLSSKLFDTHGAVTTGAAWIFTAPISGKYQVSSYTYATTSAYNIILWKNGSAYMNYAGGTSGQPATASCIVDLLAGETLQLRPNTTVTIKGSATLSSGDAAKVFIVRVGN